MVKEKDCREIQYEHADNSKHIGGKMRERILTAEEWERICDWCYDNNEDIDRDDIMNRLENEMPMEIE